MSETCAGCWVYEHRNYDLRQTGIIQASCNVDTHCRKAAIWDLPVSDSHGDLRGWRLDRVHFGGICYDVRIVSTTRRLTAEAF